MTEEFKIYIDRLKGGHTHKIEGHFDPSFLDVNEEELQFHEPVSVRGEAYLTEDHLVLHFSAKTIAQMPCAICNEKTRVTISTLNFYHTEPLAEIHGAVYDFGLSLREAILIEVPRTVECEGNCKARETLTPYMRKEAKIPKDHFPFANFDGKNNKGDSHGSTT